MSQRETPASHEPKEDIRRIVDEMNIETKRLYELLLLLLLWLTQIVSVQNLRNK